jgi:putative phage-type endonuclease
MAADPARIGPPPFTIGGSDAAAACGLDPLRSRAMLWAEKTGRVEREQTEAMRWGNMLEPLIVAALDGREGVHVVEYGTGREVSDQYRNYVTGHPDGFVEIVSGQAVLEVKTAPAFGVNDWQDDQAPARYIVQVQHYLHLTGLAHGLLAVLIGGQRLEVREVERDDELIGLMLDAEEEMHGYLVRDECPPFTGSESDAEVIRHLFPQSVTGKVARADAELERIAHDARLWHKARRKADERYTECVQQLQAAMGDAHTLVSRSDVELASWPAVTSRRLDVARVKQEAPHVAAQYESTSTARRFTLS